MPIITIILTKDGLHIYANGSSIDDIQQQSHAWHFANSQMLSVMKSYWTISEQSIPNNTLSNEIK
jgi:hypothetical protein